MSLKGILGIGVKIDDEIAPPGSLLNGVVTTDPRVGGDTLGSKFSA